jgi:alpha-L-rhamnosidase
MKSSSWNFNEGGKFIMNLEQAKWVWCDDERPNTYCCVRGELNLSAPPVSGVIHLFADSRYQFWVNGHYIGQGPTPFRKPHIYVDTFDIAKYLQTGKNVIAILGNYHGVKHCTYSIGKPGIIAKVEVIDADARRVECVTDGRWRVYRLDAYVQQVPRRTGATAWMEVYDARKEPAGWQEKDFNDSAWPQARVVEPGQFKIFPRIVPMLREYPASFVSVQGVWNVPGPAPVLDVLTKQLDEEPAIPLSVNIPSEFPFVLKAGEQGTAFCLDFGKELSGQIELDIDAPAGVVVDLCPTENLQHGRPWCFRKGGNYGRRYITREGRQTWRCVGYDGMRYVYAVVRGPHPEVMFYRLGVWRRETSLPIRARFECDDPAVNRIWEITCHTMTIGAQEVHVDCPTREQTSAWGDHIWSGLWETYMTGDTSHLRHLMLAAEQIQWSCGQVNCYPFSAADFFPLYDYSFVCVMGMWVYVKVSGDIDLGKRLIPVADRIFNWYRKHMGPSGLIEIDGQKAIDAGTGQLFIDHPGLGTHNHPEYPGLDRRGISAGLNLFFILALEAGANIHSQAGEDKKAESLRKEADTVRSAARGLFYDPKRKVYADSSYDGKISNHISQQTNALAVLSNTCPPDLRKDILSSVLSPRHDLCQCGTYFWTYFSAALCRAGMHREMWSEVVRLWNGMAEKGATSWWETFLGDDLDSLCHIWSCVPGYILLAEILGVKPAEIGFSKLIIRPRFDLLSRVKGSVPVRNGKVDVEWQALSDHQKQVRITNDTDAPAVVELPPGWTCREKMELPPRREFSFRSFKD